MERDPSSQLRPIFDPSASIPSSSRVQAAFPEPGALSVERGRLQGSIAPLLSRSQMEILHREKRSPARQESAGSPALLQEYPPVLPAHGAGISLSRRGFQLAAPPPLPSTRITRKGTARRGGWQCQLTVALLTECQHCQDQPRAASTGFIISWFFPSHHPVVIPSRHSLAAQSGIWGPKFVVIFLLSDI